MVIDPDSIEEFLEMQPADREEEFKRARQTAVLANLGIGTVIGAGLGALLGNTAHGAGMGLVAGGVYTATVSMPDIDKFESAVKREAELDAG